MAKVTIEGSRTTPSVALAPGVRKTVALTERVERLIARGFVVEIERFEDDPVAPEQPEGDEQAPESELEHPPYDANRDVWADFLAGHEPPIEFSAKDDRDVLINRWQQAVQVQQ
jgi:hypothetical protein